MHKHSKKENKRNKGGGWGNVLSQNLVWRPFSFSFNFFPKFALLGHVLKGGSIENEGSTCK